LEVVNLDPAADGRWDRFVTGHEQATVYHLAAWAKILTSTYRFKLRYLALEDDAKQLRAVMPLLYKRGPVSGARLRSLPVVPVGGPLAEYEQLERELMSAACELVGDREQLVVTTSSSTLAQLHDLAVRPGLPRWVVPLDADTQARWRRTGRNPGRGVRQSQAAGVSVREASTDQDLAAFYRLYLRSQRRLRALPRRYRQLELTRDLLGPSGHFRLFLVEHEQRPIAGAVWLAFGKTVEGLYFGGDERCTHLRPTHALYAHVLEWALAQGYHELDLGGALPGSSLAYFKSQWGAEPVPLYFYVHPAQAAPQDTTVPPAPTSVEIAEVGWLDRVYNRVPLPLIRLAGAFVYRYL
jgi:serine/alanine adding enzyme